MEGRIDAVTVGSGTAGTFTGIARFLKERLPHVHTVVVETEGSVLGGGKPGPHKVEGIGSSFIPRNFDASVCDEVMMVTDVQAFGMVKELAAREGVLGGSSAGANVYAAVQMARRLGAGKRVVTLIPDSAERYYRRRFLKAEFKSYNPWLFAPEANIDERTSMSQHRFPNPGDSLTNNKSGFATRAIHDGQEPDPLDRRGFTCHLCDLDLRSGRNRQAQRLRIRAGVESHSRPA